MPARPLPQWLLLIHQLPPKPDYLRVKVWRRLQALGAVAVKNTVYALPSNEQTREDFQWLQKEIEGIGGEASVCEARFVDGLSDAQIRALFNAARDSDYAQLAEELREELAGAVTASSRNDELRSRTRRLQKRFEQIATLDFFHAEGRGAAESLLRELDAALAERSLPSEPGRRRAGFTGRTWATRANIRVDRMASAWMIRRFIDPGARFLFVGESDPRTADELRFDMVDADFTHEGDRCTFEVLLARFELADPALSAIGRIIHDLDLKDGKFKPDEAAGIAAVLHGIGAADIDDPERLRRSAVVFDALHLALTARCSDQ